jgi:hypothetical protein
MSATAAMEIGSDLWNARLYAGLSQASELAAELNRPRFLASGLFFHWKMFRQLGLMNRGLEELFEKCDRFAMRHQVGTSPLPIAPEEYRAFRDDCLRLHAIRIRVLSQQDSFPRNSFMRKRLARFQANSERLLDLADWFDAMSTPEELNAKFDAALADLANGDVVPWAAVQ